MSAINTESNTKDSIRNEQPNSVKIYHERQSKQLCALHALNNLFQSPQAFKKQELDAICKELAPNARILNPHRSALGLGSYDVNVIIAALARKDFDVKWFDKRKELSELNFKNIFGLILNVPNSQQFNGLLSIPFNYIPQLWSSQKHWISIRKIGPYFYNLDSKLSAPLCIGDEVAVLSYLACKNSIEQFELLVVIAKSVSEEESWLNH